MRMPKEVKALLGATDYLFVTAADLVGADEASRMPGQQLSALLLLGHITTSDYRMSMDD
jgi:hypothetical protein